MNKFSSGLFVVLILSVDLLNAQNSGLDKQYYLWPTDASQHLTSAFCEYRGRRFHAGIDIKTWGKIGYNVYAVRPGYIWRIYMSPFGYGKALYLRLDTGETAVFAHLSKFSKKIQKFVEAEQRRLGRYRINRYLKPGQMPVAQGDIIAYTGQTGIGAPHLHFEIRDANNRPINPLSKGYILPDKVSPILTKISFTPLDANSEVNGDFKPIILTPQWIRTGEYTVNEVISFWGNVGMAISAYDIDGNSPNRFGAYGFKLYVDDVLRFQYQYDEMSFRINPMVELERDYRLSRRKFGRFNKLYKDKHNVKTNYNPNKTWAGVLRSASLQANPKLFSEWDSKSTPDNNSVQTGALFPGEHDYKIEVSDYYGNISTVQGQLQVGAAYNLQPVLTRENYGMLILSDILTYELRKLGSVEVFELTGNRWRLIPLKHSQISEPVENNTGEMFGKEFYKSENVLLLKDPSANPLILKFIGRDQFGSQSYPYFYIESTPVELTNPPQFDVNYDFYNDYLRIEIHSNQILRQIPKLILYPERPDSIAIKLQQTNLRSYVGRLNYNVLKGSYHLLKVTSQNLNNEEIVHWNGFEATQINPPRSNRIISENQDFWINFTKGSLFEPIYSRITTDSLMDAQDTKIVRPVYIAEPQDIPLNKGAEVVFKYADNESQPEKLGVYYFTSKGKWSFVDNKLDTKKKMVSAKVFSLEKFALIRDEIPPEIKNMSPRNRARLKTSPLLISAHIEDKLSGIDSEKDIVARLNGKRLIAEYDPERNRIFYEIKQPLAKGRYEVTVWAQDRSANDAFQKSIFWIE